MKDRVIISTLIVLIIATIFSIFLSVGDKFSLGEATRVCTETHTSVAIGDDIATQILAKGSRQWVIIQQPANATNTVALKLNGTAVMGQGYTLNGGISSTTESIKFGYATEFPSSALIQAITNFGSSTINVIECK